jgi:hypothetical protein
MDYNILAQSTENSVLAWLMEQLAGDLDKSTVRING